MHNELIPIERKDGVTIYGRIVDTKCKLGQYEVHSDILGHDGIVYSLYSEAERRMSTLIGFHNNKLNSKK